VPDLPWLPRRQAKAAQPAYTIASSSGSPAPARSPAWIAAMVGHELRAPLATALVYLGLADQQLVAGTPAAAIRSTLTVAREEIRRIERLIARVTELQRLGRVVLCPRRADFGELVADSVQRMLLSTSAPKVTVNARQGLVGWWDEAAVEQIVQNLVSNAIKFGAGRPVRVTVGPVGSDARLTVSDRGVGIDPADLQRIFAFRVHSPPERAGGLGIGLWLVHKLTEAHGGRVSVQSRPGQGSTFRVVLRPLPH
jgi:signal transduction histidine kinase